MRDPNAPKRPLTGYMRFSCAIRPQVEKESGLVGIKTAPLLSQAWKALSPEEQAVHNNAFKEEMVEYREKMAAYKQTDSYREFQDAKNQKKFKKRPKDKNAPKKAPSAYFIFCNEKRASVRAEKPSASMKEMGVTFGKMWKELTEEEKKPYFEKNLELKAIWKTQFEEYKQTENYVNHQNKVAKFNRDKKRALGGNKKRKAKKVEQMEE